MNFISGAPNEVVWLRNGKEVKSSDSHKQEKDGDTYRLTIKQAVSDDSGVYQCEAFHPSSSAASVATVLVQSKCKFFLNWYHSNFVMKQFFSAKSTTPQVVRLPQPVTIRTGQAASFKLDLADITNLTGNLSF